jgi:hypothetical protein
MAHFPAARDGRHVHGRAIRVLLSLGQIFRAAAVVGQKHNQCILFLARPFQSLQNLPDILVHPVDLRRVNLHPPLVPLAVRRVLPCRDLFVPRRDPPFRIYDSHFDLPRMPFSPERVPSVAIPSALPFDVALESVERPVRRSKRRI